MVVNLIGTTRTRTGLRVKAVLDTGQAVTTEQFKALNLTGHRFRPDWTCTLSPQTVPRPRAS